MGEQRHSTRSNAACCWAVRILPTEDLGRAVEVFRGPQIKWLYIEHTTIGKRDVFSLPPIKYLKSLTQRYETGPTIMKYLSKCAVVRGLI